MGNEFTYKALKNNEINTGFIGHWLATPKTDQAPGIDGEIEFQTGHKKIVFFAEIKNEVKNIQLEQILRLAQQYRPLIVLAKRIFPGMKEALRQHEIAYLEENGNFFLKYEDMHVLIEGKKPLPIDKAKTNRAFTRTGLKVIFEFLLDETLINAPYRDIARRTKTALGNINYIVNGLKDDGFILLKDKGDYQLNNKKELLEKWVHLYGQKLKPVLRIGKFRMLNGENFRDWKKLPIRPMKTWWGGEPAGDLLTDYLQPAILTLYTLEARDTLIRQYRLIPDDTGPVEIYERFWAWDEDKGNMVPPLLVYADLINTEDPRCIETAKKIYDELIAKQF